MKIAALLPALLLLAAGCVDKAKADYDKCLQLDRSYDEKGAAAACRAAVAADPNSPSGEAAAKKLIDLQAVEDRIKAADRDKAAREARIQKDEPVVVAAPTDPAAAAPADPLADAGLGDVLEQAYATYTSGDQDGALAILERYVPTKNGKPTPAATRAMRSVCNKHHDKQCLGMLALLQKR